MPANIASAKWNASIEIYFLEIFYVTLIFIQHAIISDKFL